MKTMNTTLALFPWASCYYVIVFDIKIVMKETFASTDGAHITVALQHHCNLRAVTELVVHFANFARSCSYLFVAFIRSATAPEFAA